MWSEYQIFVSKTYNLEWQQNWEWKWEGDVEGEGEWQWQWQKSAIT